MKTRPHLLGEDARMGMSRVRLLKSREDFVEALRHTDAQIELCMRVARAAEAARSTIDDHAALTPTDNEVRNRKEMVEQLTQSIATTREMLGRRQSVLAAHLETWT